MEDAARARGFPIREELQDKPFQFGDMTLRFLNLNPQRRSENNNSVVVLITVYGRSVLLAGDISSHNGLEDEIAKQIKAATKLPLDILKIAHHGYTLSTSTGFLRALRPKLAVATNDLGKIYPNVKWNLALASKSTTISSVQENGVIIAFATDGRISLSNCIHLAN